MARLGFVKNLMTGLYIISHPAKEWPAKERRQKSTLHVTKQTVEPEILTLFSS